MTIMSKIETTSKVSLKLTSRINLGKLFVKDFFRRCDQICRKLRNWPHPLKKPPMESPMPDSPRSGTKEKLKEAMVDTASQATPQRRIPLQQAMQEPELRRSTHHESWKEVPRDENQKTATSSSQKDSSPQTGRTKLGVSPAFKIIILFCRPVHPSCDQFACLSIQSLKEFL